VTLVGQSILRDKAGLANTAFPGGPAGFGLRSGILIDFFFEAKNPKKGELRAAANEKKPPDRTVSSLPWSA